MLERDRLREEWKLLQLATSPRMFLCGPLVNGSLFGQCSEHAASAISESMPTQPPDAFEHLHENEWNGHPEYAPAVLSLRLFHPLCVLCSDHFDGICSLYLLIFCVVIHL